MKVLYIGHYREQSGVSVAAINYIRALTSVGIDVVCRPIKLNNNNSFNEKDIIALESKSLDNITHCIQHLLPHQMIYYSGIKNIGLFVNDTNPTPYEWKRNLDLMDEIWCPTEWVAATITEDSYIKTKLNTPIKLVPHAANTNKYKKTYHSYYNIPEVNETYKFYTIGEANKRKNIGDFVRAFHTTFKPWEPVSLIIKTNHPNCSPNELAKHIADSCNEIKKDLRLYPLLENYKSEVIITDRATDDQINGLHYYGNCYVNTSRAEGWNQPMFDAVGFNKSVISYASKEYSMYPYFGFNENHYMIDCDTENCFAYDAAFPFIGTAREKWLTSNLNDLCNCMRSAYEDTSVYKSDVSSYSYESIGNLMKGILEND